MTAKKLQDLLDRAGISQRGAAAKLQINERTMRRYVSGDAPIPFIVWLACKYLWEKTEAKP